MGMMSNANVQTLKFYLNTYCLSVVKNPPSKDGTQKWDTVVERMRPQGLMGLHVLGTKTTQFGG